MPIAVSTVFSLLIIFFHTNLTSFSTPLDESVSYCEFLGECETISRLQERLCLGNSLLTPYWLPSRNPANQRCYTALRSHYQKLERLEHESDSLLLLCMIERSMPLTKHQKQYCDTSLFETVNKLREEDGSPSLDQCFQGNKRFERQCGPLRQCCNAYDRCKDLVRRSFITEQKEALLKEIREAARKCKEGTFFQADNVTDASNATTINPERFTMVLSTSTNQTDSSDAMQNVLYSSPGKWYMALKTKLMKETEDTMFQRHTTVVVTQNGSVTDKNDDHNQTLPSVSTIVELNEQAEPEGTDRQIVTDVTEKWDNAEYRKGIEEYQAWRAQQHLMHSVKAELYNESLCDSYVRCRRQVEKSMDRCQMFWNRVDQIPLLSTVTLLQIGDRCIGHGDDSFAELYELAIRRIGQLRKCLNRYKEQSEASTNCWAMSTNHTRRNWWLKFRDSIEQQQNTAADCFAQVNAVQFACAQLRQCCPYFYRCREETFDAKAELRIASLTVQLISQNYDCLMHKLTTNGDR